MTATKTARRVAVALMLFALLSAFAMMRELNHDESQYIAATQLALTGLPYRDFAYLQTPLQPMLFAPLAALFPHHLFVALRLVNAACGAGAILLLWVALKRAGVGDKAAWIAAGLMTLSAPLLLAAAVARNDALPALLFCASLALLAGPQKPRNVALAALLLGSAAAAKISYAIPAAALMAMAVAGPRDVKERLPLAPLIGGFAVPTAFVAILALLAPDAFWFEVIRYAVEAPREWYGATGRTGALGTGHVVKFLRNGLYGPMLAALLICGVAAWRARPWQAAERASMTIFALLLAASIVAAFLPNPTHLQYWVPALPPLFLCLGMALDRRQPLAWYGKLLLAGTAVAGLAETSVGVVHALREGLPAFRIERDAAALRRLLDAHGVSGPVAGIVPERFADSGRPVDRRFVTGPFLFRTMHLISSDEARRWHVMPFGQVSTLREEPPAAIVTLAAPEEYRGDAFLKRKLDQAAVEAGFVPIGRAGPMILWLPIKRRPGPPPAFR
ncbi:MAG: hypothetical protein H0W65_07195 [Sphingomonas sp.]|nr:hypothetical protein [Sphingomonas sp.]